MAVSIITGNKHSLHKVCRRVGKASETGGTESREGEESRAPDD